MNLGKSNRQIKYGALLSYAGIGINILVTLFYTPWMVNSIDKSNYAIFTLANSFIGLFLIDFGFGAAISKFVAQYRAEGNSKKIEWILSVVFEVYLVADIVLMFILTVLYFFIDKIYVGLTASELEIFRSVYIIVGIYSVASFPLTPITGALNAYEKFIQIQIINIAQKLSTVLFTIIGLILINDVRVVVVANAVIGFCSIWLKTKMSKSYAQCRFKKVALKWQELKGIIDFSIWTTVISVSNRFTFSMAPTVLGITSTSSEIALFAPANALESYFYTVASAINGFFLPKISRYVANGESEKMTRLLIRVGRYQTILMGLIFSVFVVIGKSFMSLWMGTDFVGAASCALLLFLPDMLSFSEQIAATTVLAENLIRKYSVGHVLMAAFSLAFMAILGGKLGALGTCLGIALAYFIEFLWDNYIYNRYLSLNMRKFYFECYLKLLLPIMLYAFAIKALLDKITIDGMLTEICTKSIVAIFLYLLLLLFLLDTDERTIVKDALRKYVRHNNGGNE